MNLLRQLRPPSPTISAIINDPAHPSHLHAEPFLTTESLARKSLLIHHESTQKQAEMLLLHATGSVKIGEILRYKITYRPSRERTLPLPNSLHLRIKNTEAIPLRAAYLHGPFVLYCSVKSEHFSHWEPVVNPREEGGYPEFEPNLKAGSSWECELPVPATMRRNIMTRERTRRSSTSGRKIGDKVEKSEEEDESITWVVEIVSQMIFSSTARISFDLAVARDEKSLNHYGTGFENGTFSRAIEFSVLNTDQLWNMPPFPGDTGNQYIMGKDGPSKKNSKNKGPKKVHLVLITHGIHSNCGADMLFVKESIDKTTKELRAARRRARREARARSSSEMDVVATGGVETVEEEDDDDDDDEEQIITRGFHGNVCRTERGIKYLGKRLARYAFSLSYPDRPIPASLRSHKAKENAGWKLEEDGTEKPGFEANYQVTSISFIGHSLGGLVQTYAIAYIHAHDSNFFRDIKPVNFVALATPFLGLSNENPIYVKFALDFGLVGRTGQDLGLTWRAPNMATSAMSGFNLMPGSSASVKSDESNASQNSPGAKPLLRILPLGPAKEVLTMFRNRTVYANVVNDGVVPLRTSCLLFLDWKGLGRVEKARRANEGPIGQVSGLVGWGLGQLTSGTSSPRRSWHRRTPSQITDTDDGSVEGERSATESAVGEAPLTNKPVKTKTWRQSNNYDGTVTEGSVVATGAQPGHQAPSAFSSFWTLFKPHAGARHQKRTQKILSRSQVIGSSDSMSASSTSHSSTTASSTASLPPLITENVVTSPTSVTSAPSSSSLSRASLTSADSSTTITAATSYKTAQETQPENLLSDDPTTTARGKATAADDNPDAENYEKMMAPPRTTLLEAAGDILNPPLPPLSFLINPETRPRTIFHDRVYHPSDIPPLPNAPAPAPGAMRRSYTSGRLSRSASYNSEASNDGANSLTSPTASTSNSGNIFAGFNLSPTAPSKNGASSPTNPHSPTGSSTNLSSTAAKNLKPEEKIARAFHDGISWRKVLVRLEPDAHNNIIVRREFSNAYGWPVVRHLVETHFGDTLAAQIRDDDEGSGERALEVDTPTFEGILPGGDLGGGDLSVRVDEYDGDDGGDLGVRNSGLGERRNGKKVWKGGEVEVDDSVSAVGMSSLGLTGSSRAAGDSDDGRSSGSATPRRKDHHHHHHHGPGSRPMSPVWSDRGDCSSESEDEESDKEIKKKKQEMDDERRRMEVIDSFLGKSPTSPTPTIRLAGDKGKKVVDGDEVDVGVSDVNAQGTTTSAAAAPVPESPHGLAGMATKVGLGMGIGTGDVVQARESLERVRERDDLANSKGD